MKIHAPNCLATVIYRTEILEAGRVIRTRDPKRNLILDVGLDSMGTNAGGWHSAIDYCAVGTGTTPTKRDSGTITFSRSGARVTASDAFFQAADVGRLLKFDSGEEMYVRIYVSETQVDVSENGALPAAEGTLWHVEQTQLTTQTKRASYASALDNTVVYDADSGTVRFRRTFLFPVETAPVAYTEIGWARQLSGTLFGRDLIPGGGDALTANQQYRVTVDLYVSVSPRTPQTVTVPEIFGGTAQAQLEDLRSFWPTSRVGDTYGMNICLEDGKALRATVFDTKATYPVAGSRFYVPSLAAAYISGSFKLRYLLTVAGAATGTAYKFQSIALSNGEGGDFPSNYRVLLPAEFTRNPYYTLAIEFTISWGRVLIN